MSTRFRNGVAAFVCLVAIGTGATALAGSGDYDDDGYVGLLDYAALLGCLEASGPGGTGLPIRCWTRFNSDGDFDIDLKDVAEFMRLLGHVSIPLRDATGEVLTVGSVEPYSGRQTCGTVGCHDVDHIANGSHFSQGLTDTPGNIIMHDDFLTDGRSWNRSAGMYGRWSGGSGGFNRQTAGKTNANASSMDLTAFSWSAECGTCHVGGGPAEFDRDGERLYGYYDDTEMFEFGYERLGLGAGDVALDGDYTVVDQTSGTVSLAPWEVTGVADPECLHCHRADRTWSDGKDMQREWRASVLSASTRLVDGAGDPVPAFAAAGTAGQGWFSTLDAEGDPPVLQIDYSVGVGNGSLLQNLDDTLSIPDGALAYRPTDRACWGCHLPGGAGEKRGMVWFDERDVHYKKFTNRSDEDPTNDISDENATVCSHCHVGNVDHNVAKGNSPFTQFRNELDFQEFRTCRECHLKELPDFSLNPLKDPDAPDVPGNVTVHMLGFYEFEDAGPMRSLSCQACHVPYALERGLIVTDWSLTGTPVFYHTDEFLSADPLDPENDDTSRWYPVLRKKMDSDGLIRYFPQNAEIAIYWADWNRNDPEDSTDDTIQPIILWRLVQITQGQRLEGVTDDNGDGKYEVNTPAEMLLYMQALKANDSNGVPVATNPVLVKGTRVWYEDLGEPNNINSFDYEEADIAIEPFEYYGLDHNVLPASESWGAGDDPAMFCGICHEPPSPFVDRKILVDPFGVDGQPIYRTNREVRDPTDPNDIGLDP